MTREEAKVYLNNYRKMYADLAPERFLEALDIMLNEPRLTEEMYEAAQKSAIITYKMPENCDVDFSHKTVEARGFHEIGFEAGAEWQKKKMLDEAVRMDVGMLGNYLPMMVVHEPTEWSNFPAKLGAEVKVIVIKDE